MGLLRRIDPQMTGLLRYQLFLSIGILFIGLWKASITRLETIQKTLSTSIDPSTTKILVIYLPIWAIILLGIYALSSVLYKVATFGDCPEAAVELSGQIEEAKQKLTKQGFKFWERNQGVILILEIIKLLMRRFWLRMLGELISCSMQCNTTTETFLTIHWEIISIKINYFVQFKHIPLSVSSAIHVFNTVTLHNTP